MRANSTVRLIDRSQPERPVVVHALAADGAEQQIEADHVVVAVGAQPATTVAELAGLELDPTNGGVVVGSDLRAFGDVYAAGDVASFFDTSLKLRRRVEHHDHAVASGRVAGLNMSSSSKPQRYTHQAVFSSVVGDLKFRAVGRVDASLDTVAVWDEAGAATPLAGNTRGVVYYVDKNKIVGVVLVNLAGSVDEARRVVARPKLVFATQRTPTRFSDRCLFIVVQYWDKTILKGLISIEK